MSVVSSMRATPSIAIPWGESHFSESKTDQKIQKHKKALYTAMQDKDCSNFLYHLTKIPLNELDKNSSIRFIKENKEKLSKFIIKREVNKTADKLNDKIAWPGCINTICPAKRVNLEGNEVYKTKIGLQTFEDITIYELRRSVAKSSSLLLGYLRLEKNPSLDVNHRPVNVYQVGYLATGAVSIGKGLAYLLLNYTINDVLNANPAAKIQLHDCSGGKGTRLYHDVGKDNEEQEFKKTSALEMDEPWFFYTKP